MKQRFTLLAFFAAFLVLVVAPSAQAATLVAHWKFDETSSADDFTGNRIDSGPNGLGLSHVGNSYSRGATGVDGNAMLTRSDDTFTTFGDTTGLSAADNDLFDLDSFSFSAFVDPYVNGDKVALFGRGRIWGAEILPERTFVFYVGRPDNTFAGAASAAIPTEAWDGLGEGGKGDEVNNIEQWYHLAGTYDATSGNIALYLDGVATTATAGPGTPRHSVYSDPFEVGSRTGFNLAGMLGLYDDLQLYDGVLSSGEVDFLRNNPGSVIPEPGTIILLLAGLIGLLAVRRR